jgi:TP53 regulating kinase and related kinases
MSAKEIVNDVVIPSSSSYVKNESWTLISQGAEARVWKIPILLEQVPSDETQQQISNNGQPLSPPVKRTRLLEEEEKDPHVNDEEDVQQQQQQQQWMVAKERFKKSYRHSQLDERLTRQRCRMEARILEKCYNKSSSVTAGNSNDACTTTILRVPRVHRLDPPILFLEYLPGRTVRDALEVDLLPAFLLHQQQQQAEQQAPIETNSSVVLLDLSQRMGRMIRHLHNLGIVHGDLTTSNMMLVPKVRKQQQQPNTSSATALPPPPPIATDINNDDHDDDDELALIDFGLAKNTESAEERAVDLYVLERALISTHPSLPASFIETLLDAYSSFGKCSSNNHDATKSSSSKTNGNSDSAKSSSSSAAAAAATLRRLEQVRQRGRKRECFG